MDINIASGGPIVVRGLKGGDRVFARLLMEDLGVLQAHVPGDHRFVTVFELNDFAQTHLGADQVLLLSLRRDDPAATAADVRKLGSLLQRVELARVLMGEVLTTGEDEVLAAESAKQKKTESPNPPTG